MKPNLCLFDRLVSAVLGLAFFWSSAELFVNPVAQVLFALLGLGALLEAVLGVCLLARRLGVMSCGDRMKPEQVRLVSLAGISVVLGYEWFVAGYEKIVGGEFASSLETTLGFFASKNPWPWVASFLNGFAADNAVLFGQLVQWGELAVGVGLILSIALFVYFGRADQKHVALVIAILALTFGALMNVVFYLTAGWTSPSTHGVNLVMFWTQIIIAYGWIQELRAARV